MGAPRVSTQSLQGVVALNRLPPPQKNGAS
jgi:hypothetical protein